jgi:hypothetical protein
MMMIALYVFFSLSLAVFALPIADTRSNPHVPSIRNFHDASHDFSPVESVPIANAVKETDEEMKLRRVWEWLMNHVDLAIDKGYTSSPISFAKQRASADFVYELDFDDSDAASLLVDEEDGGEETASELLFDLEI